MSDGEKIAFLAGELSTHLKMNRPGGATTQVKKGYDQAIQVIDGLKQYLINKESDEQEHKEAVGY